MKIDVLKKNSIKMKIYCLCNGKTTSLEIAEKIGKTSEYVGSVLSRLKKEKMIFMVIDKKTGRKIPVKINHLSDKHHNGKIQKD